MTYRKTSVEINEALFEAAQRVLETRTVKDTIDHAFREVVRQEARRSEIEELTSMRSLDLDDEDLMKGAWRP